MARDADTVNFAGLTLDGYHQPIPGYEILERIGSGGMGSVYKARQQSLDRIVALKVLRKDRLDDPRSLERLKKEARLLARFDHPNIVRGIDMGEAGPYVYFAMDLVEGKSLKDVLAESGPLNELAALRIVEKVALALEHAAANGITHRDVKPGNILLGRGGVVKLSDFGLALGPLDTGTRSGTLGTPQYISPEQAKHPKRTDVRADLFSLGATFYHMLTGQPPFPGDSVAEVITAVLFRAPKPPDELRPGLHPSTSRVLARLMAKSPRLRYQTPRDLIDDLDVLKRLLGGSGSDGGEIGLSWAKAGEREVAWWRQPLMLSLASGLLLVVVLAIVVASRPRSQGQLNAQAQQLIELQSRVANGAPEAMVALMREYDLKPYPKLYEAATRKVRDPFLAELENLAREAATLQTDRGEPWNARMLLAQKSEQLRQTFFGDSITPAELYGELEDQRLDRLSLLEERNREIVAKWADRQREYLDQLEQDVEAALDQGKLEDAQRVLKRDRFPPRGERIPLILSFSTAGMQAPPCEALPPADGKGLFDREQGVRDALGDQIGIRITNGVTALRSALDEKGKPLIQAESERRQDQPVDAIAAQHIAALKRGVSQAVLDAAAGDIEAFRKTFEARLAEAREAFARAQQEHNAEGLDEDLHARLSERDYATAKNVLQAGAIKGVPVDWLATRQGWLTELGRIKSDAFRALKDLRGESIDLKSKGGVTMSGVVVEADQDGGTVQLKNIKDPILFGDLSADTLLAFARRKGVVSAVAEALLRSSDGEAAKAEEALKGATQEQVTAVHAYWDRLKIVKTSQRNDTIEKVRLYERQADDASSDQERQLLLRYAVDAATGDDEEMRTIREALRHRLDQVTSAIERASTEQKMRSLWHGSSRLDQDGTLSLEYDFERDDELQDFAVPGPHYQLAHGALVAALPPGSERGNLFKQTTGVVFPSRPPRELPRLFDPRAPASVSFTVQFPYEAGTPEFFAVEVQGHCFGIRSPPDLTLEGQLNAWEGSIDGYEPYFFYPDLGDTKPKKGEITTFRLRHGTRYRFLIEYDPERHELVLKIDDVIKYRKPNTTLGKGRIEIRPARPFALEDFKVIGRPDPSWRRG